MRICGPFQIGPEPCPYLPGRQALYEAVYIERIGPEEFEAMLNRGYRKSGRVLYRMRCPGCRECRPLRIPVARFRPDRSQRRAWKRNADVEVSFGPPELDAERLELYARYHRAQSERKGWPEAQRNAEEYAACFLNGAVPSVEIRLRLEGRLCGIVLTEIGPQVVSGVYHYYDPEQPARSLGTFCLLQTIELARRLGRPWAHFGFYVAGCPSLAYKARFRPHELLDVDGVWREPPAPAEPLATETPRA